MKSTLIANNSGLVSQFITEDDAGYLKTTQDVSKTIEYTKHLAEQNPSKDFRHVAEVPFVIWEKAVQEGWHKDRAQWKKWLNDPNNKMFRSWPGKV